MAQAPAARTILELLRAQHGSQKWWPAKSAFEVMIGAVLVQRTSWTNAALAIANLKSHDLLGYRPLAAMSEVDLAALIRPAGFFRVKAKRLKSLAQFVERSGGVSALGDMTTMELRQALLALPGVGPETADAILLYAFERPAVVIDEYTRRLLRRLSADDGAWTDGEIRAWVERDVHAVADLNELHALIVEHGKRVCGKDPQCVRCHLTARCRSAVTQSSVQPKPDSRR